MHETHSLRERFLVFFKIFVPILIYQFANFSAAFVDTTMTGQYDALHLAGVAMATSLWSPFFTFLTGIVSALVPIIGHHLGAGRKDRVAPDFYQFLYMALGLSLILFALVFLGAPLVLNHLGLEPLVRKVALGYLRFLSLGIIPLLLFTLIGFAIANLGLNNIIAFSVPVLLILYPITITIVMIVIANKFVALSKPGMQITVAVVTLIALLSVIGSQFKLAGLNALINFLPLSGASLPWLIPAILCILLSLVLPDKIKSESFEME